jgi:hypothetical protein
MEPIKIVIRYEDGRTIKGHTQNFFPNKPTFHITPVDPQIFNGPLEVKVTDLKAIFFVRDFLGDRTYKERKTFPNGLKIVGRNVEVTFKDQEVLIGSVLGYDPNRPGFFLFPTDSNSNNLNVFVVSRAVSKVKYLSS